MDDRTTTPRGETSSEEIRREIRRTRTDMDETVDALTERLSPGSILDEVWQRVRNGDGLTSVVRDHPMPLALMGLGLGWLAIEQAGGSSQNAGPGTHARAEGRKGPYRGEAVNGDDPDWEHAAASTKAKAMFSDVASSAGGKASEAASAGKEKVMDVAAAMKEKAGDAASSMKGSANSARDSASSMADSARSSVSHAASKASRAGGEAARGANSGFWDLLQDQPLAMGALAFGLGLAGGLSFPSTDPEDRIVGRTSETLKDEARRVGKTTAGKVGRVASATVDATLDEVERQNRERDVGGPAQASLEQLRETAGEVADEVTAAAKEVVETAGETARETAAEEKLDAASLKAEAETAAERTGEQARKDARRATGHVTGGEKEEDTSTPASRSP